jgi:hypothetical protein
MCVGTIAVNAMVQESPKSGGAIMVTEDQLVGADLMQQVSRHANRNTTCSSENEPLPGGGSPDIGPATSFPLRIGPINGLTSAWHFAPSYVELPVGATVHFCQPCPMGATVTWTNADVIQQDAQGSMGECRLTSAGNLFVVARIEESDGTVTEHLCRINVLNRRIEEFGVTAILPTVAEVDLNEYSSNEETMTYYFADESIATLWQINPNYYVTSVDRTVDFTAIVDPPGFAPLVEWRYGYMESGAQPLSAGAAFSHRIEGIGVNPFTAGPQGGRTVLEIETYSVTIQNYTSVVDIIPEGVPITFEAVTDPPGHEARIRWISSTKYGSASPVLGSGSTFTVQYDDTIGYDPEVGSWQWLGVRGDNTVFGQDQKPNLISCDDGPQPCPPPANPLWCRYRADNIVGNRSADCVAVGAPAIGTLFCVECPPGPPCPDPVSYRFTSAALPAAACVIMASREAGTGNSCVSCPHASRWILVP